MRGPFVDRIEGGIAVLIREGREERVPLSSLPERAREGVYLTEDLTAIDEAATEAARRSAAGRRAKLGADDDGGDLSL